jgi:hypothetical protein
MQCDPFSFRRLRHSVCYLRCRSALRRRRPRRHPPPLDRHPPPSPRPQYRTLKPLRVPDRCGSTPPPRSITAQETSGTGRPKRASTCPKLKPKAAGSGLTTTRPARRRGRMWRRMRRGGTWRRGRKNPKPPRCVAGWQNARTGQVFRCLLRGSHHNLEPIVPYIEAAGIRGPRPGVRECPHRLPGPVRDQNGPYGAPRRFSRAA